MSFLTIPADEIRPGDAIYVDNYAKNKNHCYFNVKKIRRVPLLGHGPNPPIQIVVTVAGVDRWYDPREMILIQRFDALN